MSGDSNAAEESDRRDSLSYLALTFALMGGAAVWLVRLIVNTSLVVYSCRISATWPLWIPTAVTTIVAGAALAVSWRFYRTGNGELAGAVSWLGLLGVMFNVTAIIGILFESVPIAVLDVCRSAFAT